MSPSRFLTVLLLVVMALATLSGPVAAQGAQPAAPDAPLSAAFTYQGSLRSGGAPATAPSISSSSSTTRPAAAARWAPRWPWRMWP